MAKMNVYYGVGQVVSDKVNVVTAEKNKKLSFRVVINLPAGTEWKGHFFNVETWVKNESKLEEALTKGACVDITGKLLENTKVRQDGSTAKEAYIQASRVNIVKDGKLANRSDLNAHVFVAAPPVTRGKTTAVRVGVEGLYDKTNETNNVMFLDAIYFGENAERVLKHIHKNDSMNISGNQRAYHAGR